MNYARAKELAMKMEENERKEKPMKTKITDEDLSYGSITYDEVLRNPDRYEYVSNRKSETAEDRAYRLQSRVYELEREVQDMKDRLQRKG